MKQGVSHEDHLVQADLEDVPQVSNAITRVDARLGNTDRCGSAQPDRKLREELVNELLDLLSLGKVRVPFGLFVEWRSVPKRAGSDLAAPIFDRFAPELLRKRNPQIVS